MLLTVTARATSGGPLQDARDLGFLLAKHPDRAQSAATATGTAHVFYPERSAERTTAALLLEVDPDALARSGRSGRSGGTAAQEAFGLGQYVSDRPYTASSLLAVAIGRVFRSAAAGRCPGHEELAAAALDLELHLPATSCRAGRTAGGAACGAAGADLARRLFAPLGWQVDAAPVPLDPEVPAWGDADLLDLRLRGRLRLADALTHVYVLLPVLDDAKHYWVGSDEVDKLVRAGGDWLAAHPERELITRRYLRHSRPLVDDATSRLAELDGLDGLDATAEERSDAPPRPSAAADRLAVVLAALRGAGARTVLDLGCGEGRLVEALLADPAVSRVVGVDVSAGELARARRRLALERRSDAERARVELLLGSLTYRDPRFAGFDAAVLSEVVEHVDEDRLPALEHTVFAAARPATVVVTTPNADHNALFDALPAGAVRHADHRFEWTRAQFRAWARGVGERHGYAAAFTGAGADDADLGPTTQVAVLTRTTGAA